MISILKVIFNFIKNSSISSVIIVFYYSLASCSNIKNKIVTNQKKLIFVFDFDSTIVKSESLEDVIKLKIGNDLDKVNKLQNITNLGMDGKMNFRDSVNQRLNLAKLNKTDIDNISKILIKDITPEMIDVINKIKSNGNEIFVVSGSFKELILPVTKYLNIDDQNVIANEFVYDSKNNVLGSKESFMLNSNGKVTAIKNIKNNAQNQKDNQKDNIKVIMIGDGYNDLLTYIENVADIFIGFGVHVQRERVKKEAPVFVKTMYEFKREVGKILRD